MSLTAYLSERKKQKDILMMTHQILGYPDFTTNEAALDLFAKNGVDLVELQIPFSEPVADGPVFMHANQKAVENGVKVRDCLAWIAKMVKKYDFPILIMTYYNILYCFGVEAFVQECQAIGVKGLIVPDAPVDEAQLFFESCKKYGVAAIGLVTPYTTKERLALICEAIKGFIYYVPRKGVTGSKTQFDSNVLLKIQNVRTDSKRDIAVGFGIQSPEDIQALAGRADIAVIGSKILTVLEEGGLASLSHFLQSLNAERGAKNV